MKESDTSTLRKRRRLRHFVHVVVKVSREGQDHTLDGIARSKVEDCST